MPTLVMMHGMTGNADMMRPFAEKVLPDGWTLIVPEARYKHPRRGRTWWRYEDEDADATRRMNLSRRELIDVDSSLSQLEQIIAEQAPMGPLVVGGFSQGGAMAQEMLQLPMADRIVGVVAIGTRLVRGMELGPTSCRTRSETSVLDAWRAGCSRFHSGWLGGSSHLRGRRLGFGIDRASKRPHDPNGTSCSVERVADCVKPSTLVVRRIHQ